MSMQELFERYDGAWGRHDLDTIVSLHTEDSIFHLHAGEAEAVGRDAIRTAFGDLLASYPDLRFEPQSVRFGADFILFQYVIHAAGASLDSVDVFVVRDGLVARKDTYLDATKLPTAPASVR